MELFSTCPLCIILSTDQLTAAFNEEKFMPQKLFDLNKILTTASSAPATGSSQGGWNWKLRLIQVQYWRCSTWGVAVVQFQHWVLSMRSTREGFVEAMLVTNMITTKVFAIPILNFSCYSFVRAPAFSFVRSYLVSGTTQTNLLLAGGQNFIICVFAFSQGLLAFWQPLLFSLVLSCFFTWLEKLSASWNLSSVYFPCFWLPGFCLCCFLCSCFWCSRFQRLLFLAVEWLWLHWSRPAGVPLTLAPPHLHRSAMHKTKF